MAGRDEIVAYSNERLEVDRFPEFGRPGLQVVGAAGVEKIACGVSASLELFERAAEAGAQLVLVHHGLFWRSEPGRSKRAYCVQSVCSRSPGQGHS